MNQQLDFLWVIGWVKMSDRLGVESGKDDDQGSRDLRALRPRTRGLGDRL